MHSSLFGGWLKISLVSLFFFLTSTSVYALQTVEAVGRASTTAKDRMVARDEALNDALRNAIEQVLGSVLTAESITENYSRFDETIFTKVRGYVKKYEILGESYSNDLVVIRIEAQVEDIDLANDVAALAHVLPRMHYPSIIIIVNQKELNKDQETVEVEIKTAEQVLAKILTNKGFRVVEATAKKAEKLRQIHLLSMTGDNVNQALEMASHLAQVMIIGQAAVQDSGSAYKSKLHSYGAFLSAKVYETGTGSLLATASSDASEPHFNFVIGSQKAMEKAAEKLAPELSDQIIKAWLDACYNDHDVTLIVENLPYGALTSIKEQILRHIRGVTRVHQKHYIRGRAELVLGWRDCDIPRLAQQMDNMKLSSGLVQILEVQGNTIRLSYKEK